MQQRYYDPVAGRFLSVDPVTTDAKTGDHFNRYVYGENNPYVYTDPDGRAPIREDMGAGSGRAGGLGARNLDGTPVRHSVAESRVNLQADRAAISGNAQVTKSGGQETTHASTSARLANEAAKAPDAKSVHLNQTVKTITGGQSTSAVRPDVATVRQDGKVNVTEVLSPGQSPSAAIQKNQNALGNLAGDIKAVPPDPKIK